MVRASQQHYNQLVNHYDQLPFYAPDSPFVKKLSLFLLPFTTNKSVVDIGAGTCAFTELLAAKSMSCVDISEKLLYQHPVLPNQEKVLADGIEFLANTDKHFDVCLIKECLHHFSKQEQIQLLQLSHQKATTLILIMRLASNHYPWFHQAQLNFEKSCIDKLRLEQMLHDAHYSSRKYEITNPISLPITYWIDMLKQRFWSNLEGISKQEFTKGLSELQLKYKKNVAFNDKICVFICTSEAPPKPGQIE